MRIPGHRQSSENIIIIMNQKVWEVMYVTPLFKEIKLLFVSALYKSIQSVQSKARQSAAGINV